MPSKIFLLGATGYIGGSLLTVLLKSPEKYTISALVRNKDQAEKLKELGVTPILGSLDDTELLVEAAKNADAVVNTADADHLSSVQALLKGLKAKQDKRAVLLHTSGSALIAFQQTTPKPWDDEDIERIHSIPHTAPHNHVDSYIFDNLDGITGATICPGTVNGVGFGPFKKSSIQTIGLAKIAAQRKQAGYMGPRTDVEWANVHIIDLIDLYILVLDGLLAGTIEHGRKGGFYFGVADHHTWYKVVELLGEVLYKNGRVSTPSISPLEPPYVALFGPFGEAAFQSDCKAVANRSKKLGWKPHHPHVYDTLEEEIDYLIKNKEI